MPSITNSTRRVNRATYAPISISNNPTDVANRSKTVSIFEKLGYLQSLRLQQAEASALANAIATSNDANGGQDLKTLAAMLPAIDLNDPFAISSTTLKELSKLNSAALLGYGRLLKERRKNVSKEINIIVDSLKAAYSASLKNDPGNTPGTSTSLIATPTPRTRLDTARSNNNESWQITISATAAETVERTTAKSPVEVAAKTKPLEDAAIRWAAKNSVQEYASLVSKAQPYSAVRLVGENATDFINDLLSATVDLGVRTGTAIESFEERLAIEPVGRLHLERLEMYPVSIERGELLYSLPLAPRETVRLSHKEWAVRTEEFERIVQDSMEEFSENGVTEKSDISQSTTSQQTHSSALSLSGGYSGFGFSASVGYNSTSDDSRVMTDSRNNSIELTRKASSRVRQDHKISYKVTATTGSEEEAVRVITNPSDTNVMRLDYFKLMRKWRVDLFRFGIRMTYDIVIPDPGSDLRKNIEEINALDRMLEEPFRFDLALSAITTDNWAALGVQYKATVDPPPPLEIWQQQYRELPEKTRGESSGVDFDSLDFDVPDEYEIKSALASASLTTWTSDSPGSPIFDILKDEVGAGGSTYNSGLEQVIGLSGRISVIFRWENSRTGLVNVQLTLVPKESTIKNWQFRTWDNIRRAAHESFTMERQNLRDRRAKLQEELAQMDALTLRQMEKEAIMKGVLKWLFGPGFDLVPPDIISLFTTVGNEAEIDPSRLNTAQWQRVLEYGEFIKFLHQAIEWENVLYFLYPYFWDTPTSWSSKRFLKHPDIIHRSFLRAGSARVVLTIRPGFEESFIQVLQNGSFGELETDHPYLTIAQEIKNYAETNYPGIPPANPAEPETDVLVGTREQGILIGQWHEYTPTGATDITMNSDLTELA